MVGGANSQPQGDCWGMAENILCQLVLGHNGYGKSLGNRNAFDPLMAKFLWTLAFLTPPCEPASLVTTPRNQQ
eukprot:6379327-Pyramimonas_sp.AAC.1